MMMMILDGRISRYGTHDFMHDLEIESGDREKQKQLLHCRQTQRAHWLLKCY